MENSFAYTQEAGGGEGEVPRKAHKGIEAITGLLIEMRLLIDEQLLGCGVLLKSTGYEVVLANETGLQRDEDLVEYAVKNGLFVVTEDNGMATLCKFREVPHLHLDVSMKARIIVEELKKRNIKPR